MSSVNADEAAMVEAFGSAEPEQRVLLHFYRDTDMKHLLPAFRRVAQDPTLPEDMGYRTRCIFFLAEVMKTMTPKTRSQFVAQLMIVSKFDPIDMLAALHQMPAGMGAQSFKVLASSVRGTGNESAASVAEVLAESPVEPLHAWPLPHVPGPLDEDVFLSSWHTSGASVYDFAGLPTLLRRAHAKKWTEDAASQDATAAEYGTALGNCMIDGLMSSFNASGEDVFLRRIVQAAMPWAAFSSTPGAVDLVMDLDKPLTPEVESLINSAERPHLARMRAVLSRYAVWVLLQHAHAHEAVFRVLAEEASSMGEWVVQGDFADPSMRARLGPVNARARLQLLPAMLHLAGQAALQRDADLSAAALPAGPSKAER